MYVESSKDILYLVISFCVLWVTVFLCWMFYYVMKILRNTSEIVEEFRMRLQKLTETIEYIRGKVEHMSGLMTMATSGVGGLVKNFVSKRAKDWVEKSTNKFDMAAKEAVNNAVEATAKKMKKATSRMRK